MIITALFLAASSLFINLSSYHFAYRSGRSPVLLFGIMTAMAKPTGRNDPCPCGSGKKYKKCCGMPKSEVVQVRVKDLRDLEWTPGLADALVNSLDPAYIEYFTAASSGASTEKAEKAIAAISEDKRYLTRVLDSLDNAFADADTETAKLDLPHMRDRKPEAIKDYLQFRLRQIKLLLDAVDDYLDEKHPRPEGHA